jgi:hypothetical protein
LTWHLLLLGNALGGLAPQHAAPLVTQLEEIVDTTLQVREHDIFLAQRA